MGPLLGAIITLCTFGGTFWARRRSGKPCDYGFALKLVGASAGVGSICVGGIYPLLYVLISKAIFGGTIITNLPQGVTEDALLGMALVGGVIVGVGVVYGLLEVLRS